VIVVAIVSSGQFATFKSKIQDKEKSIPPHQRHLLFAGKKALEDHRIIANYNNFIPKR